MESLQDDFCAARKSDLIVLLIIGAFKRGFTNEKCILSGERINKYRR